MPLNAILNISSVEQFILDEGSHSNNIYQLCLVWVEELGIYLLAGGVRCSSKESCTSIS